MSNVYFFLHMSCFLIMLSNSLKQELKTVFGPRYKRMLLDSEVITIVKNLVGVMEEILKFKWRQKYEKITG